MQLTYGVGVLGGLEIGIGLIDNRSAGHVGYSSIELLLLSRRV